MKAVPIWLRCHTDKAGLSRGAVTAALALKGICLCDPEDQPPRSGGLFVFSHADDAIYQELRQLSCLGANRVLAVAADRTALAGGTAWRLLRCGACDVFSWDSTEDPGSAIAARLERYAQVDELVDSEPVREHLVGRSPAWLNVLRQVVEVARFTDASVLLTGESGTGKELVARLIHTLDPRQGKRELVVLDCTTVVPELAGSEFFGHERGAFTHAISARDGAFALADGGTLFLDEVGELSLTLQAELLRVVQEGAYKRVGSNTWRQIHFRLVCATNRDLLEEQRSGTFRSDFYHRIASWTCTLPTLSERQEDILPLARHFLKEVHRSESRPDLDPLVQDYLLTREYPGNVRELRQLVHRIAKRHVGNGPITIGNIPENERHGALEALRMAWHDGEFQRPIRRALASGAGLKEITQRAAETAIQIALAEAEGNLQRAAATLKVTDRALQMRRAAAQPLGPAPPDLDPTQASAADAEAEKQKRKKGKAAAQSAGTSAASQGS
jgi:DNA-binding NtrC family response regulator